MDQTHRPHEIRIRIDQLEKLLMFDYDPAHEDALYDILDPEGRIVKTGDKELALELEKTGYAEFVDAA